MKKSYKFRLFKDKLFMRFFLFYFLLCFFNSCQNEKVVKESIISIKWTYEKLNQHALNQMDSLQWDKEMLKQDIDFFKNYITAFSEYPENKSPFPVTDYEYAVYSEPFVINEDVILKGYRIGEYESFESEKKIDKLILIILTNDKDSEDATFVNSRNFPYLTAEGYFKTSVDIYKWTLTSSPDGFATLFINTKLFDLRFGKTILIYPQKDGSIRFTQLNTLPSDYINFKEFKNFILKNNNVKHQLYSKDNI